MQAAVHDLRVHAAHGKIEVEMARFGASLPAALTTDLTTGRQLQTQGGQIEATAPPIDLPRERLHRHAIQIERTGQAVRDGKTADDPRQLGLTHRLESRLQRQFCCGQAVRPIHRMHTGQVDPGAAEGHWRKRRQSHLGLPVHALLCNDFQRQAGQRPVRRQGQGERPRYKLPADLRAGLQRKGRLTIQPGLRTDAYRRHRKSQLFELMADPIAVQLRLHLQ